MTTVDEATPHSSPGEGGARSLTSRTITGLRWTYLAVGITFALQLVYQVVINRLLPPAAFGLMAIGWLAMRFGNFFASMGLERALIQKEELSELDVRTAFTLNVIIASVVCAGLWLSAPFVSEYFGSPEARDVVRAIGFGVVLLGAGMTANGLLKRQMRFRALALREIAAYVIGFPVVGIALALAGAGVWSLVAAVLTGSFVSAATAYAAVRHSVRPALSGESARRLLSFGGRVSVISFLEWVGGNLDTVAVGRFVSTALLGQYNRAYFLVTYPTNRLGSDVSKVLFPGFSRIQADNDRLRRAYLSGLTISGFVILPLCAGIAVAGREFVFAVLGPQWDVAAELIPWMALAVAFSLMAHLAGVVTEARADLNRKLALQLTTLAVLAVLLLAARGRGLWAFAAALALAHGVRVSLYLLLLRRLLEVRLRDLLRGWVPGVVAAAATAAAIAAVRLPLVDLGLPPALLLAADITVGAITLPVVLRWGPVGEVRRQLRNRLAAAGLLDGSGLRARVIRWFVGPPRSSGSAPGSELT